MRRNKTKTKAQKRKKPQRKLPKKRTTRKEVPTKSWIPGDFEKNTTFPLFDFSAYEGFSAVDLFELMFDNGIFRLLEEETKKYAILTTGRTPKITIEEIKCSIGILIYTGYNKLPGKNIYWTNDPDLNNEFVKSKNSYF